MKLIISPAKKMKTDDALPVRKLPRFLPKAVRLAAYLQSLPLPELQRLLCCSRTLAEQSYGYFQHLDFYRNLTPALLAYDGIQYRYMAPGVFTDREFTYLEEHLLILSGLYGLLEPFDGVAPYRLEMQAKVKTEFCDSLYSYWGADLGKAIAAQDDTVLNLASEEYSRAVKRYLPAGVRFITPVFGEFIGGKIIEKGVYVKMARGEMVRFLAENGVHSPQGMIHFNRLNYQYHPELSDEKNVVFLRERRLAPPV